MTDYPLPVYQHELRELDQRQLGALLSGLNPARIASRGQGRSTLSYLEAWDVKATLIKVFGFGGFSAEVVDSKIERILTKEEAGGNAAWVVLATATVRLYIHQLGAVYTETAASSQAGSQIGEVADFAIKTAESDALKRAAIYLGTQFGLSLYNNGSTADIVKVILDPVQGSVLLNPDQKASLELQTKREVEYIEAIVEGIDPVTARENIWGAPQAQPQQQVQQQQQQPVQQQGPPPGSSLTPEQYAETQAQIQRGLTMRQQQAPAEQQGVDFAALAEQEQGQSAVLEQQDFSAEAEAYAAADGHHE